MPKMERFTKSMIVAVVAEWVTGFAVELAFGATPIHAVITANLVVAACNVVLTLVFVARM